MGSLVLGGVVLVAAFLVLVTTAGLKSDPARPSPYLLRSAGWLLGVVGTNVDDLL